MRIIIVSRRLWIKKKNVLLMFIPILEAMMTTAQILVLPTLNWIEFEWLPYI